MRCAVKVQQQVPIYDGDHPSDRRIRFRIGINIGDVISHGTDLHGDGVNVAARLEAACPVGGLCVSRSVRDHVHGRLDLTFEPIGELTLKNIARPVEAFVPRLDATVRQPARRRGLGSWRAWPRKTRVAAGAAVFLLVAGVGWWRYRGTELSSHRLPAATAFNSAIATAPRLSIVVLPLENLGGDAKDDYLAEGVTDDLTTALSNIFSAFVIARNSAYAYKGKSINAKQIGEELGVRYVLEGRFRRLGDVLRVNAQLISADNGAHLWADRFDEPIRDLASGQEAIVRRLGAALRWEMLRIEATRSLRERPDDPDAFDLILRARSLMSQPLQPATDVRGEDPV